MNVTVELQNASGSSIPLRRQFRHWATAALRGSSTGNNTGSNATGNNTTRNAQLSIRIVDETESAALNSHYRHKDGATNILSFPVPAGMAAGKMAAGKQLGDLAICAPVVKAEARNQNKSEDAHWAHLVVHGVLHLQGFEHENNKDAAEMEALEISILAQLGIADPYQGNK